MKTAGIGDYLLWEGKPGKIIGYTDQKTLIIEILEDKKCPHCNGNLGREQIHVVESSPMFQYGAEKLQTIKED